MGPKLLFTVLCDDVREEKSGKLLLVGLYNYDITFFQEPSPGRDRAIAPIGTANISAVKFALPQLCLVRRWMVEGAGDKTRTQIIGPDGKTYADVETELRVPLGGGYHQEIIRIAGLALAPGMYLIRTSFPGGTSEDRFEVRIKPLGETVSPIPR